MKVRLTIDVPEGAHARQAATLASALIRMGHAMAFLGAIPLSPSPIYDPSGAVIGRFSAEPDADTRRAPSESGGGA